MPLDRGLVQVITGDGKGKTTAGVGQAVRSLGRGLRVAFVQFVKGGQPSGELEGLRVLGADVARPAERSAALMRGPADDEDRRAAAEAWSIACDAIGSGRYDVVVCDELAVALGYNLVEATEVFEALAGRPAHVEVVITGRNAPEELVAIADYVSEVRAVKHPFDAGISARRGIEY